MYILKLIFICSLLLLVQPIRTFCIYNQLMEGTHIVAKQNRDSFPPDKLFSEKIKQNEKKCCHFSNKDCSPNGNDDDPVEFRILFITETLNKAKVYKTECTTGGGLTFYNKEDDKRYVSCRFANGTTADVPLQEP